MFHIELSSDEQRVLAEILSSSLTTLDLEIHRTDTREYKDLLQARRATLEQILAKVGIPAQAVV